MNLMTAIRDELIQLMHERVAGFKWRRLCGRERTVLPYYDVSCDCTSIT